ncbi:hypothetical protein KTN05_03805 [Paracoccus sp. Z118]|uniref:hypothetical protein n=1 Tax=Paracoccus sp. Z118 TaxID=2851017 RepID=UPI001C2CB3F9|nr:hypothetical protein [Paracoccus sp. Z118]MBV0890972.1 hypothetical protein [Paracoccus sp. Z118]
MLHAIMKPKILTTLRGFRRDDFVADAIAGVIASRVPPGAGLLTAIVAIFLLATLGGNSVQIGGVTGAFIVVVAGVVATHGLTG